MTVVEALPMDIYEALYHYCKDDESLNDAFIRALRTELFRWHDLRKNPQDLPPRKGFETYSERLITDKGYSVYNFRKCRWYVDEPDCDCMVHREVIAWCEIPVFLEGEE